MVAINADAHSTEGFVHMRYGIVMARRAGLRADQVLNARPLGGLRDWLRARRLSRGLVSAPAPRPPAADGSAAS